MRYFCFLLFVFGISCQLPESNSDRIVARVNDNFLYASELTKNIKQNLSSADSAAMAMNFINTWAKQQLLLEKAVFNLNNLQQEALESLIRQYRNDLFIKSYQEEWIKYRIDTILSNEEYTSYYNENKENFKLHQDVMRGRFIRLPLLNFNRKSIAKAIRRFNFDDINFLDSISLQFHSSYLNDSVWIRPQVFFNKLNMSNRIDYDQYLKSNRFFEIEDSLDLYLVFIEEIRRRNEIAPFAHLETTLKQILLNKRKLEMIRRFDNDILQEAIKENTFEIYE
jgi:hypothetical protein